MSADRAQAGRIAREKGRSRELDVLDVLRADWPYAARCAWGCADVVCAKLGDDGRPILWLVQVKCTGGGPYERFLPRDREQLIATADACGAEAWLAWWPPYGSLQWIDAHSWPKRASVEQRAAAGARVAGVAL